MKPVKTAVFPPFLAPRLGASMKAMQERGKNGCFHGFNFEVGFQITLKNLKNLKFGKNRRIKTTLGHPQKNRRVTAKKFE